MEIAEVYRAVAPKLQSYLIGDGCAPATAADIVQETFLRLWKRREALSDDFHQVSGLAFTIARNYRTDLARKEQRERVSCASQAVGDESELAELQAESRPGDEEENFVLRKRLASTLDRMPSQLLETFALSRLGSLSARDIADGTGTSEANVKVRVHRARALFKAYFDERTESAGAMAESGGHDSVLKALMMLAAVDGEISKEELSLYRAFAEKIRSTKADRFDALWREALRGMAYIGFLSEILPPEEIAREYVRETGAIPRRFIVLLEKMAFADGNYSRIERDCVMALARKCL